MSWLRDTHEKFNAIHEETSGADPGKSLAWIVAIQVVAYYLCSSFISIIFYLGMFVYIYFRWIRPMYGFEITAKEDKHDGNDEPEWLLDQFFSYIQQHTDGDKEKSSYLKEDDVTEEMIDQLEIEKDTEVPEVDDEPTWLIDTFLTYVQQHKDDETDAHCEKVDENIADENIADEKALDDVCHLEENVESELLVACSVANSTATSLPDAENIDEDDLEEEFEIVDAQDFD